MTKSIKLLSFVACKPDVLNPFDSLGFQEGNDDWFRQLSPAMQREYIQNHPNSRFAQSPLPDAAPAPRKTIGEKFVEHIKRVKPTSLPHDTTRVVGEKVDTLMTNMDENATKNLMLSMQSKHTSDKHKAARAKFFGSVGATLLAGASILLTMTPAANLGEYLGGYAAYKLTGHDHFDQGWGKRDEEKQNKKFQLKDEDFRTPEAFKAAVAERLKGMTEGFSSNELERINKMATDANGGREISNVPPTPPVPPQN